MKRLHIVVSNPTPQANVPILTGRKPAPESDQPPFVTKAAIDAFTENCRRAGLLDENGLIVRSHGSDAAKGPAPAGG